MHAVLKALFVAATLCLCLPSVHGEILSLGHGTDIRIEEKTATWSIDDLRGGLRIQNGRTEADLDLQPRGEGRFEAPELPDVKFQVQFLPQPDRVEVEITIQNDGKEQLWLEPLLDVVMKAAKFEWFDGFKTHDKPGKREDLTGTLPFAAIYQNGKGLAVGIDPTQLVSHFASNVSVQDGEARLTFSSKMVVDAGAEEKRRFVLFAFPAEFQYLNAVSIYQNWFPQVFKMTEGLHPNIAGPGFRNLFWRSQHDIYPASKEKNYFPQIIEALRWAGTGWDWCYAGFGYRPGDWLCTEEWTGDWIVNDKGNGEIPLRKFLNKSAAEYLQLHFDAYERMNALHVAPMMYVIPSYCEQELAKSRFADSIYYNAQGQPSVTGPPWVVRFDRSTVMYPYGNSFGDYTQDAMKKIVERSNIRGFAFDCIDKANLQYIGPGTERSPGRAYDKERGVYVNQEIAHAMFGREVHELSRDGYVMGLTGNNRGSSGSYLSFSVMDAGIIEHSPWDQRPLPFTMRLLMGKKPLTYWHGYQNVPGADKLSGEQLIKTLSTLADFTVLQSLHLGLYPSIAAVIGSPKLIYYSRIFNDLFQNYGWEPVPAVHGAEALWLSRYGSGTGGVLVAGNATPREISEPLEVVASYFDAASVAFVDYEGKQAVTNKIEGGHTRLPISLQQGEAAIRAAGLHWEQPVTATVEGKREKSAGEFIRDTWKIELPEASAQPLFVAALPGHTLKSILVDGKPCEFRQEDDIAKFQPNFAKGENMMQIVYVPDVFISNKAALTKIKLLDDGKKPHFTIVLAEDTPELRYQALRIQSLFSEMDIDKPLAPIPVVVKNDEAPKGVTVILGISESAAQAGISVSGDAIHITGRNADALEKAVSLLLEEWHPVYGSYGYLLASNEQIQGYLTDLRPGFFQEKTGKKFLPWDGAK